ncbi:MAG: hypothetical protein V4441_12380 [Pseudomonadota bacterium]
MNKHDKDVADAIIRQNFMAFVIKFFSIMNPGAVFQENWHHRAIAHELIQCELGFEFSRLIVNLPPQHGKSELISVLYVAWLLGRDPTLNILCVSYGEPIAERFAYLTLMAMQSNEYQRIFPGTTLVKTALSELVTSKGGRRMARSVHGPITGHPADVIVLDDPHKIDSSLTNAELEKTSKWADETLAARLTKPIEGKIICVKQRISLNDLTGHYLSKPNEPWRQLKLPLVATEDEVIATGPNETYHRKKGEILHPAWRGPKDVLIAKQSPRIFASQYQQDPMPEGGVILKPEQIGSYTEFRRHHNYEHIFLGIDGASSLAEHASYSAIVAVGIRENRFYALDAWRGHVELPELRKMALKFYEDFGPSHILIEDAASGIGLHQMLRPQFDNQGVYSVPPQGSKEQRLYEVQHLFIENRVLFPHKSLETKDMSTLRQELLTAPHGKTDDLMDAFVLILRSIIKYAAHNRLPISYLHHKVPGHFWTKHK